METFATDSGEGSTGGDGGAEVAASPVRRGRALPGGGHRPGSSAEAAGHHGARPVFPASAHSAGASVLLHRHPPRLHLGLLPLLPADASSHLRPAAPAPAVFSAVAVVVIVSTLMARTQSNAGERLGAGRSCHFVAPREQKCSSQRDFRGFGSRAVAKTAVWQGSM
jgi:hypothetical protein